MSGDARRAPKRLAKEPRSRTGRYYRRQREEPKEDFELDSSSSFYSSFRQGTEYFKEQQERAEKDFLPSSSSSNSSFDDPGSPSRHCTPLKSLIEQSSFNFSLNDPASPLRHSTPLKSQIEQSNSKLSYIEESTCNVPFPVSNFDVTFAADQGSVDELNSTIMGQEENFENYTIVDPLPNDVGDFDDTQRENVDVSDFLHSSDEEDVSDDDDVNGFINYCLDNSERENDDVHHLLQSSDDEDVNVDDSQRENVNVSDILHSTDEEHLRDIDLNEFINYCESQESPSTEEADPHLSEMKKFLREWSSKNSISLLALSELAKGLKETHPTCFSKLPTDGRTIMGTFVHKLDVKQVPPGEYVHLWIKKQLEFAGSLISENVDSFGLLFNIDGVKIYKHTKSSLYVILMTIPTCRSLKNKVFPVGLYYGPGKPKNMAVFLRPFIDEMISLLIGNNFCLDQKVVKILLLGFCCDTPARSEILETVGHTGFYSCFRCTTKGKSVSTERVAKGHERKRGKAKKGKGSKRVFLAVNDPPREDFAFRNKMYPKFQPANRQLSPLVEIPGLHFTRSFILDPMHLVFIGVTRHLLALLFLAGPYMLKPSLRMQVQRKLEESIPFIPSDFPRKPTDIRNVGGCKATESRLYLLYLGPVILKNSLDKERYVHFMELTIAKRIYHHVSFFVTESLLYHFHLNSPSEVL